MCIESLLVRLVVRFEIGGWNISSDCVPVLHIPPLSASGDGNHSDHLTSDHGHHAAVVILGDKLVLSVVELAPRIIS